MNERKSTFRPSEQDAERISGIIQECNTLILGDPFDLIKKEYPLMSDQTVKRWIKRLTADPTDTKFHGREVNKQETPAAAEPDPEDAINTLVDLVGNYRRVTAENVVLKIENELLKADRVELERKLDELYPMEHEYKQLLQIMNRARTLAVGYAPRETFKMDQNGNLERVE